MRSKMLCALAVTAGTLTVVPVASAAPPSNDVFGAPADLGNAPTTVRGSLDEATTEAGEPSHGRQTVWYSYRPSVSGRVAVELRGFQNMSPVLSVYTGSTLDTLQAVGRDDDYYTRVPFEAVAGQTYRIAVGMRYASGDADFELRVRNAPLPAHDAFSKAKTVRIPGEYTGNLKDATSELGENESHRHSVWYRIRPRRTVNLTADLVAEDCFRPLMTVYTGSRLSKLRKIRSGVPIRVKVLRGRVYRLAVDCRRTGFGDFKLSLSDGSIKGKGVKLAVANGQTVESVREDGLRMTVSTKRRVGVGIELRVSRRTARRLGLESRVLGRTSGAVDYNKALPAVLRLSSAARRALADVEHLNATVRLEILNSDAPNRVLTVLVSL
jgi:hypothetical protein